MPPIHFLIEHIAHHILTVCPWNLKARNPCSQCDQSNLVHEHMSQVHSIAHHSRSSHAMNRQTITPKTAISPQEKGKARTYATKRAMYATSKMTAVAEATTPAMFPNHDLHDWDSDGSDAFATSFPDASEYPSAV